MKGKENGKRNDSSNHGNKRTEPSGTASGVDTSGTVRSDASGVSTVASSVTGSNVATRNSGESLTAERSENTSVGGTNPILDRETRKFIKPDGTIGFRRPGRNRIDDSGTTTTSTTNRIGSETGSGNVRKENNTLVTDIEAPPFTKKERNTKKKQKDFETQKLAIVTVLGTLINLVFKLLAFRFGKHWLLQDEETLEISTDLDNALSTLPGEYYEQALNFGGKVAPWAALCITAHTITSPRLEKTKLERTNRVTAKSGSKDNGVVREEQKPIPTAWAAASLPFDLSNGM